MTPSRVVRHWWQFVDVVLVLIVTAGVAYAQSRPDCHSAQRAVGVAIGRTGPYFEPSLRSDASGSSGSVQSGGGLQLAGRAELPIAGAWRARVEGATANWRLERKTYSADFRQVIATETIGNVDVRQIIGLIGRQGGRAPVCGYVLAGGGLYSLHSQGTSVRGGGVALMAGLEFPGGPRGAVQLDLQLHLIETGGWYPIGSSTVVEHRFSAGWVYRF